MEIILVQNGKITILKWDIVVMSNITAQKQSYVIKITWCMILETRLKTGQPNVRNNITIRLLAQILQ